MVSRQAVPGAFVNTGAAVVGLVNDEDMEIEADVPANRLAGLIPGRTIGALLDGGNEIEAVVRAVIPTENALTRTRPVRFTPRLSDGPAMRLATDQSVTVMIPVGEPRSVVTVHKDAVIARGSSYIVFVVRAGGGPPGRPGRGGRRADRGAVRPGARRRCGGAGQRKAAAGPAGDLQGRAEAGWRRLTGRRPWI